MLARINMRVDIFVYTWNDEGKAMYLSQHAVSSAPSTCFPSLECICPHLSTTLKTRCWLYCLGCGIVGMQYIVRKEEDMLSGALVSSTCGASGCTGSEEYTTGVLWAKKYYFLRVSCRRCSLDHVCAEFFTNSVYIASSSPQMT